MKNTRVLILLLSLISCAQKKDRQTDSYLLYRYNRFVGGNNGYVSYLDDVVIDNYENNSLTIKQLYNYAKNYIDTVKADKNVSSISLIGRRPGSTLPEASGFDNTPEQRKYFVASFGFDNGFKKYANNKNHKLVDITIWKNGEAIDFMFDNSPPYYEKYYKKKVDSLLNCPIPVDAGF